MEKFTFMEEFTFGVVITIAAGLLRHYKYNIVVIFIMTMIGLCGFLGIQWFVNLEANTVRYGMHIALRTVDGKYVTTDLHGNAYLAGRAKKIGDWEIFEIVDPENPFSYDTTKIVHYGDIIALRAINHGHFVRSHSGRENKLIADMPWVQDWERFVLYNPNDKFLSHTFARLMYGDTFALRAHHGQYVSYVPSRNGDLESIATDIQENAIFVCIDPERPK
jgi:hypothetical protein